MQKLLFSIAFTFLVSTAFAQFSAGLAVGGNFSDLTWHLKPLNSDLGYDPALGWRAAVMGQWRFSSALAVRAEIAAQSKNSKTKVQLTDGMGGPEIEGTARIHHFFTEGSLLLEWAPFSGMRSAYFLAGCTAGRFTQGHYSYSKSLGLENSNIDIDFEEAAYNRNAVAVDLGLGYNFALGSRNTLKVEGRYQHGLMDLSDHENVDASLNPFILQVGYLHQL
jgi:hypothetical protein